MTTEGRIRTLWVSVTTFIASLLLIVLVTNITAQASRIDLTIGLNEYQGSGVSGWATLAPTIDGVRVTMAVEGTAITGNHPTHIHTGTCDDFDPDPTFPLTTFILDPLTDDGASKTMLDVVSLQELLSDDYVIVVHKSHEELTTYFTCGDITLANAYVGPKSAGSIEVPDTGSGSGSVNGVTIRGAPFLASIGALAVLLALMSLQLRRQRASRS